MQQRISTAKFIWLRSMQGGTYLVLKCIVLYAMCFLVIWQMSSSTNSSLIKVK